MATIEIAHSRGALVPSARARAMERLTAAVLYHQGVEDNPRSRALVWTTIQELAPGAFAVGGREPVDPFYRVRVSVPEGTLLHGPGPVGAGARSNLVCEITEILLEAEGTAFSLAAAGRVCCVISEVRDGFWGMLGTTYRMDDIYSLTTLEKPDTPITDEGHRALEELLAAAPAARRGDGIGDSGWTPPQAEPGRP